MSCLCVCVVGCERGAGQTTAQTLEGRYLELMSENERLVVRSVHAAREQQGLGSRVDVLSRELVKRREMARRDGLQKRVFTSWMGCSSRSLCRAREPLLARTAALLCEKRHGGQVGHFFRAWTATSREHRRQQSAARAFVLPLLASRLRRRILAGLIAVHNGFIVTSKMTKNSNCNSNSTCVNFRSGNSSKRNNHFNTRELFTSKGASAPLAICLFDAALTLASLSPSPPPHLPQGWFVDGWMPPPGEQLIVSM